MILAVYLNNNTTYSYYSKYYIDKKNVGFKNYILYLNALYNIIIEGNENISILHVCVKITFVVGIAYWIMVIKMCRLEMSDGHGHYGNQLPRSFRVFTIKQKTCNIK